MNQAGDEVSISLICEVLGYSRQAYYQRMQMIREQKFRVEIVLELVKDKRKRMPRLGGKKLYKLLKTDFIKLDYKLGRDAFFELLKEHGMLVKKRKNYTKTTNSFHRFYVYKNLLTGLEVTRSNQVIVSDITYVRVAGGFMYLSLVTDLYSRRINGWDLSDTLEAEGSIRALEMALTEAGDCLDSIHHSDRGVQYCSSRYVEILKKHGIRISMAEQGNPYENAVAERINGILKDEFHLGRDFISSRVAMKAVAEAIATYNDLRPHWSLKLETPSERYFGEIADQNSQNLHPPRGMNARLGASTVLGTGY